MSNVTAETTAALFPVCTRANCNAVFASNEESTALPAKRFQLPRHCSSFRSVCRPAARGCIYLYLEEILRLYLFLFFLHGDIRDRCSRLLRIPAAGTRGSYVSANLPVLTSKPSTRYQPTGQRTIGVIGWIQLSRLRSFSFGSARSSFLLLDADRRTFQTSPLCSPLQPLLEIQVDSRLGIIRTPSRMVTRLIAWDFTISAARTSLRQLKNFSFVANLKCCNCFITIAIFI